MRPLQSLVGVMSDQDVRATARALTKAGYAVVPVVIGGKKPMCTLNVRERKEQGLDHKCGVYHAMTDSAVADRVFARLTKNGERINIGIVAGPSRLVVVDADDDASVKAFIKDWATHDGDEHLLASPSIRTPGLQDDEGNWLHRDGGHFVFDVPAGDIPYDMLGMYKDEGGYDVRWGWQQSLVPPSVRKEGPYICVSEVQPLPDWLRMRIIDRITSSASRRAEKVDLCPDKNIGAWSNATTWESLLSEDGWTCTGKSDKCGCAIWTKPGGGSTSDKSATAHESECDKYKMLEGHGPLHLWTTDPPYPLSELVKDGKSTITKLQYFAATRFDNDMEAAASHVRDLNGYTEWIESLGADTLPPPIPVPEEVDEDDDDDPYDGPEEIARKIAVHAIQIHRLLRNHPYLPYVQAAVDELVVKMRNKYMAKALEDLYLLQRSGEHMVEYDLSAMYEDEEVKEVLA